MKSLPRRQNPLCVVVGLAWSIDALTLKEYILVSLLLIRRDSKIDVKFDDVQGKYSTLYRSIHKDYQYFDIELYAMR